MRRPCVQVVREEGERTRRQLEEAGIRDRDFRIESDDEHVYIPITDASAIDEDVVVVERDLDPRTETVLPEDLLEFTPTYERLGDLVLLQEDDPARARAAADAFMAADLPINGVLNQSSSVAGELRIAEWELLAGSRTETVHREYGAEFLVDPTKAYFSPRLATERQRVIEQVQPDEHIVDMFAGVGPFAIRAALVGADVVAVDLNPDAITYCRENARRNGVYEDITIIEGDIQEVSASYPGWADRLYMNLPHSADRFLETAVDLASDRCRLHYYDIQPEVDAFSPASRAITEAFEPTYAVKVIDTTVVKSYAPGVVNVCLDVDVTAR